MSMLPDRPLDPVLLREIEDAVTARMTEPTVELPVRTARALLKSAELLSRLGSIARMLHDDGERTRRYSAGPYWWGQLTDVLADVQTHLADGLRADLDASQAACAAQNIGNLHVARGEVASFVYLDHRGERATRTVVPLSVWWRAAGPEKAQWLLRAWDLDLQSARDFALDRIGGEGPAPVPDISLHRLFSRVVRGWPFGAKYAWWVRERRQAQAAHVLLHLAKQTGKLAALFEPEGHAEGPPEVAEVERQVAYVLIDALRLLDLAGGTVDGVQAVVDAWEKEENAG